MKKKEIRKILDEQVQYYMNNMIDCYNKGYKTTVEGYREKVKGILVSAEALGVVTFDEWSACNKMVSWAFMNMPIDER